MPDPIEHTARNADTGAKPPVVGRFAPSPTGRMHAGNIYAALVSWLMAKSQGGSIVLRIEDLDRERSKPQFIDAVQRDFESLGLTWDAGPYYQHDRDDAYRTAFEELQKQGRIYPCFCSRADLHVASAPHHGEKFIYPGTCKDLSPKEREAKSRTKHPAYRLSVDDVTLEINDAIQGRYRQNLAYECGDFLVRRSDSAFAYQLAVVVDDATQGVNLVVRGVDLLCSTPQQVFLQRLLGLPHPGYAHIPLLVSEQNRRLSKRDHDASLEELFLRYGSPAGVIGHIAYISGLAETDEPMMPEDILRHFNNADIQSVFDDPIQIMWQP